MSTSSPAKIALKKHHFKPYFQKIFRGAKASRTPPKCLGHSGLGDVSALRASEMYRPFGPPESWGKTWVSVEGGGKLLKCTIYIPSRGYVFQKMTAGIKIKGEEKKGKRERGREKGGKKGKKLIFG